MILYGFGSHAKKLLRKYAVPDEKIELIIDNNENGKWLADVVTWNEYVNTHDQYKSEQICIGVKDAYDEVYNQIFHSGLFDRMNIINISDWIKQFPENDNLLSYKIKQHKFIELKNVANEVGDLKPELLKQSKVLSTREKALMELPQGGVVAEIGVAFGGFSKKILEFMKPAVFYAIDMYDEQLKGFWNKNVFEEENISHYDWYRREFESYINEGTMKMVKSISWEAMEPFPDDYFDYIYLDAAHDIDSVRKDIEAILPKIKDGGIIQFNDYTYGTSNVYYGVIPMVNKMINETGSQVMFFCLDKGGYHNLVVKINKKRG
ncbi:MAG: class I SAM-dependent methyltransferase [Lachnospiraceae bacterium]|nr:class I SAM-dependent methyltransferase [Lachnospiraceae bacterium]